MMFNCPPPLRFWGILREALLIAVGILLPACAWGQRDTAVMLRSGIVIDPRGGEAYVMTPDGGVAAIDLASGATRWTTQEAAKPLEMVGNLLVAQVEPRTAANTLELVTLNTAARGARVARGGIEIPAGVRVAIGETLAGTFSTDARASGGSALVFWSFVRAPRRGMPSPEDTIVVVRPDTVRPGRAITRGIVRMNVSTGAISRLDTTVVPSPRAPRWILPAEPRRDGAAPARYESADGRHILTSEAVADDRVWRKYRWTIHERATGQRVGDHRTHVPFTPFLVRNSLLIYETTPYAVGEGPLEPARLRAFSLASDEEAWSVEVREVVFRGPFPP